MMQSEAAIHVPIRLAAESMPSCPKEMGAQEERSVTISQFNLGDRVFSWPNNGVPYGAGRPCRWGRARF